MHSHTNGSQHILDRSRDPENAFWWNYKTWSLHPFDIYKSWVLWSSTCVQRSKDLPRERCTPQKEAPKNPWDYEKSTNSAKLSCDSLRYVCEIPERKKKTTKHLEDLYKRSFWFSFRTLWPMSFFGKCILLTCLQVSLLSYFHSREVCVISWTRTSTFSSPHLSKISFNTVSKKRR